MGTSELAPRPDSGAKSDLVEPYAGDGACHLGGNQRRDGRLAFLERVGAARMKRTARGRIDRRRRITGKDDALASALASPRVVGMEMTIYDPDLDADGHLGEQLVTILERAFARAGRLGATKLA